MKKIVCLVVVVLMIAGVAIAAKRMAITAKDLPGLKGTWEGTLGFGIMEQGGTSTVKLEILNDSVPVKARLTINNVPTDVAMQVGDSGGKKVLESDNGKITSQGTIMWIG